MSQHQKETLIVIAILFLVGQVVAYLMVGFCLMDWAIFSWDPGARAISIVAGVIITIVGCMLLSLFFD